MPSQTEINSLRAIADKIHDHMRRCKRSDQCGSCKTGAEFFTNLDPMTLSKVLEERRFK